MALPSPASSKLTKSTTSAAKKRDGLEKSNSLRRRRGDNRVSTPIVVNKIKSSSSSLDDWDITGVGNETEEVKPPYQSRVKPKSSKTIIPLKTEPLEFSELETMYSKYLLAELVKLNYRKKMEREKEQAEKEIVTLWTAFENQRCRVQKKRDRREEFMALQKKLDLCTSYAESTKGLLSDLAHESGRHLFHLRKSLERRSRKLPVQGAITDGTFYKLMEDFLSNCHPRLEQNLRNDLSQSLVDIKRSYRECQDTINSAKDLSIREASIKLSASTKAVNIEEELRLVIPPPVPEPQLS